MAREADAARMELDQIRAECKNLQENTAAAVAEATALQQSAKQQDGIVREQMAAAEGVAKELEQREVIAN